MKKFQIAIFGLSAALLAPLSAAQVTLYEQEGFHGRTFTAGGPIYNLDKLGFNDRASSIIVDGGDWQICEDADFHGRCIVLRSGQYPSLGTMGMNKRISSLRRVGGGPNYSYAPSPPPPAPPPYPYYPHHGEHLFTADVVAVRAVTGPPEQRCWVEQQQVAAPAPPNVPGAIVGGVLGGVLGHQIGSGRGNDVATAIGAVGGAAIGANVNRGGGQVYTQDVQRCSAVPGTGQVAYWDVTYVFRGATHRAQLSFAPGATITVNGQGEPRV
jgi:uncharacterized protein YcfJ